MKKSVDWPISTINFSPKHPSKAVNISNSSSNNSKANVEHSTTMFTHSKFVISHFILNFCYFVFQEKLVQQDEEQRLVQSEQANIEQTLNTIHQQLQTFDHEFHLDASTSDHLRERLQQMTNTLSSVEKFHLHLISPASSTDTTVIERSQHLSSFHDQLKGSIERKLQEFNQVEKYSNEILSCQQILQNLIEICSIRLQTFQKEKSKNELFLQRSMTIFEVC